MKRFHGYVSRQPGKCRRTRDNREGPAGETEGQELGEESEKEEDPLVEFVGGEPDAETEPSAPLPADRLVDATISSSVNGSLD